MTLAEFIAELERRAVEARERSAWVLQQPDIDPDAAVQASMQYDMAAEAFEQAAALARKLEE